MQRRLRKQSLRSGCRLQSGQVAAAHCRQQQLWLRRGQRLSHARLQLLQCRCGLSLLGRACQFLLLLQSCWLQLLREGRLRRQCPGCMRQSSSRHLHCRYRRNSRLGCLTCRHLLLQHIMLGRGSWSCGCGPWLHQQHLWCDGCGRHGCHLLGQRLLGCKSLGGWCGGWLGQQLLSGDSWGYWCCCLLPEGLLSHTP